MSPVDPRDAATNIATGLAQVIRHHDSEDQRYLKEGVEILEQGILEALFFLQGRAL